MCRGRWSRPITPAEALTGPWPRTSMHVHAPRPPAWAFTCMHVNASTGPSCIQHRRDSRSNKCMHERTHMHHHACCIIMVY
eukprot:365154-Chlamydomonas_euryale.AAC.11